MVLDTVCRQEVEACQGNGQLIPSGNSLISDQADLQAVADCMVSEMHVQPVQAPGASNLAILPSAERKKPWNKKLAS
jgi:hypothetical protein